MPSCFFQVFVEQRNLRERAGAKTRDNNRHRNDPSGMMKVLHLQHVCRGNVSIITTINSHIILSAPFLKKSYFNKALISYNGINTLTCIFWDMHNVPWQSPSWWVCKCWSKELWEGSRSECWCTISAGDLPWTDSCLWILVGRSLSHCA